MECYYHPERESTDNCAICGKSICKECGLEIAGKTYCKECLEKIVGLGIENTSNSPSPSYASEDYSRVEPPRQEPGPITETIYQTQADDERYAPREDFQSHEIKQIHDDSPYNIKDNINYSRDYESDYKYDSGIAPEITPDNARQVQPNRNEYDSYPKQDPIYPDHNFDTPSNSRSNLEDKYEKYLDDLYFDESDVPLEEQLAKDEEQYGSLTHRPYHPRSEEAIQREKIAERPRNETPEEMEARIRAEILAEKNGKGGIRDSNIHNLNYKEEKEPMNAVDIILTILLVVVILIVIYYLLYIFMLQAAYPTFMDALYGLSNPQNVINNILNPIQWNIFIVYLFFKFF